MRAELNHFLTKRFPEIFRKEDKTQSEREGFLGCECGDGWFNILYQTCELVESHIKRIKDNNEFRLRVKNEIENGKEVNEYWKKEYVKHVS